MLSFHQITIWPISLTNCGTPIFLVIQLKILIFNLDYWMSDSESSEEIEVKVEQQHSAKVKQLIEKGKQILPFYSEESLYQIYKQCFQTENVFLNKLNILAKQSLNSQDNDQGWIVEKKYEKQTHYKRQEFQQNRVQRERYNFLQDTKLIERAKKYKRPQEREKEYPKKTYQQYKQKHADNQEAPKQKTFYKSQKPNQSYQQKKVLYKQKEQQVQEAKKQNQPTQKPVPQAPKVQIVATKANTESNIKKQTKPVAQKKVKYTQKKQVAKEPQVKPEQKVEPVPIAAKVEQPQVVKPKQEEKVQQVPKPKQQVNQVKQTKKQVEKIVITAKIEPLVIQQQKKQKVPEKKVVAENVPSNTSIVSGQESKTQSTTKIERSKEVIMPEVQKEFEKSVSQNSFVLSFIKPSSKLQQVSYVRYPDGKIKQVKIKQPLNKKN